MALSLTGTAHLAISSGAPAYNGDFTSAFWYNSNGSTANRYLWALWNSSTTSEDELRASNTQALRLYSYDAGATEIGGSTAFATLPAGWNLIILRRSGLNLGVSLNGSAFVEFANPATLSRLEADRFSIGSDRVGNAGVGLYWNLVHWNRALSDTEAADFYAEDYASISVTDLYDYWPLSADALAVENGNDFTEVNSPTYVSDPSGQVAWPGSASTPAGAGSADSPAMTVAATALPLTVAAAVAAAPAMTAVASGSATSSIPGAAVASTPGMSVTAAAEVTPLLPFSGQELDGVSALEPDIHVSLASGDWPLVVQLSAAASVAAGMGNPYDQAHFQWSFGNSVRPHTGSKIGVNIAPVNYHCDEWVFVDAMRMSRPWTLVGGSAGTFTVDAFGNLATIDASTSVVTYIFQGISDYPAGTYTCYYEGTGVIEWDGDVTAVLASSAGKQTISVTPSGGIELRVTSTDSGDPIRNIKLIMPGFEKGAKWRNNEFHPTFLRRMANYSHLRFMDWGAINDSDVVDWADRTTLLHATQDQDSGVCLELQIELANKLQTSPWFCIPHQASDDYVAQAAALIRERLDRNLRFKLEYSNECWNFGFAQAGYCRDQGAALSLGGTDTQNSRRYYSKRSVEIFDIFEAEFGGTSRFDRVLAEQRGGTTTLRYVLDFENAYLKCDTVAIACYFGNGSGTPPTLGGVDEATIAATWDVDDMLDWCETSLTASLTAVDTSYGVANGEYGLPLIAYEGGQHLAGFLDSTVHDLMTAANRHARMKTIYTSMLEGWATSTSDGEFCAFNSCMGFSTSGRWGLLETQTQARSTAPKYDAVQSYIEQQALCFPLIIDPHSGDVVWADSDQVGPQATFPYREPGSYTARLTMATQSSSGVVQAASVTTSITVTDTFARMYFDSVNGNDANDGSFGSPKQTWAALKTWLEDSTESRRALLAGDSVWTPTSNITISTSNRRICRYGPGANPRLVSDGNGLIRHLNTSEIVSVDDFCMQGVDIDANDLEVNAFASSGGSPLTENNPREGIHLLDCSLSNSTSSCVQIVSNGAQHVSLVSCRIDHGNGDSQGFSARLHELALSAPREFITGLDLTFVGGNGGTNGDTLDHHIYPSGWHQMGLFRWIDFGSPEATGAFCINFNCQQEGPGIDNRYMLVDGCDLKGMKFGIDHGCGTFISEEEGTLRENIIQNCSFHDFKDTSTSSCIFGRNIERLVIRDSKFFSLQDGIAYQLNCADLEVIAYRNRGHSAFGGTSDRFWRMRYAGQTWTMFDNHWMLTTGSSNRIIEFDESLTANYTLADKYWAPAQASPFEGLSGNLSMSSWLALFPDCSEEEPTWFDPSVGDFTVQGPPVATCVASTPGMSVVASGNGAISGAAVASTPGMSVVAAGGVDFQATSSGIAGAPAMTVTAGAIVLTSGSAVASTPAMSLEGAGAAVPSGTGVAGTPGMTVVAAGSSPTGVELDYDGPEDEAWRSSKFAVTVEGEEVFVWAKTHSPIMNASGWSVGDSVELSTVDFGAAKTATVVISLVDLTPITSAVLTPGDKGVVQSIVDGNLELQMPEGVQIHVEVNGDRGETIDIFSSPLKDPVPENRVDFATLIQTVAFVEGTGVITVPGHGIVGTKRVLFETSGSLPTLLSGEIVEHHPILATRINDDDLQLTDPVTMIDYDWSDEGTGTHTIVVCEWTDTENVLYFGRGVHHAGWKFSLANNCRVYVDEGAVVIATWEFNGAHLAAGGSHIYGPGKLCGDVIHPAVLRSILSGFDEWIPYAMFTGPVGPTDSTVSGVTVLSMPYYLSIQVIAYWRFVKVISPWYWSCDGIRTGTRRTLGLPSGGTDIFLFVGDDALNFVNTYGHLYTRVVAICTNNACIHGGYWPSLSSPANAVLVDCDAMHLAEDLGGLLGTDAIVKSLVDGFDSQTALMSSGVTVQGLKVWGPVKCHPVILGNTVYPFSPFEGNDRDQAGQMFDWLFEDLWFEYAPERLITIVGRDADNAPHNISFYRTVIAGVEVDNSNYTDYATVSPFSYSVIWEEVIMTAMGLCATPGMSVISRGRQFAPAVPTDLSLLKMRIHNALLDAIKAGPFYPCVVDSNTGRMTILDVPITPTGALVKEVKSMFQEAKFNRRDSGVSELASWTWAALVSFNREVACEVFERVAMATGILIPAAPGTISPRVLVARLTDSSYDHPPDQSPTNGTTVEFIFELDTKLLRK